QNQLTNLVLPPDLYRLETLNVGSNPLATFVLSEPLAAANLADTVAALRNQGVSVFTYPLALRLASPFRTASGAVEFSLTGPPGIYAVQSSTNLAAWSELGTTTNTFGRAVFT